MLFYLWVTLFVLAMIACWAANLFGVPGNWFMIVLCAIWFWFTDPQTAAHIGWQWLLVFVFLAAIGELLEFAASVLGTKKMGGSRKAAICSVVGSVIGGFIGAVFGIPVPIPIVGMVIGSVLFACIGALVGATIGERWQGSKLDQSLKVGGAAFAGRLVGTLGKMAMGSAILVLTIILLLF